MHALLQLTEFGLDFHVYKELIIYKDGRYIGAYSA